MNTKTENALKILRQYNAWRRDKNEINQHEMPNPILVGLAIDHAIEMLEQPAEQAKADFDVMAYGQSFMLDGKHIPLSDVYTQPAQEPVARIKQGDDGYPKLVFNGKFKYESISIKQPDIPLYTSPPSCQECENLKHDLEGYMDANK